MSPIRLIILIVAAGAAILAAFLVKGMSAPTTVTQVVTDQTTVVETREVSEVQILVARRDLSVGDLLAPDDFEWAAWPEKNVVEGYRTEEEHPDALEELAGSIVRSKIYEREPILPQKLVIKGDSGVMAALVGPGMRAATVEVSTESASGGFILPDDRVDVILTHEVEIANDDFVVERPVTTTIMSNVRILAVDQVFRQDEVGAESFIANTATLEVSPREAELLALAERMGALSLSLRPWSDTSDRTQRVSRTDLLDVANPYENGKGGVTIYRNGQAAAANLGGS
jgi:pilus assembly protein CpaB